MPQNQLSHQENQTTRSSRHVALPSPYLPLPSSHQSITPNLHHQNVDKLRSPRKPKAPSPDLGTGPLPSTTTAPTAPRILTPAPPSAILTLTTLAPLDVQPWREAFTALLEKLDKQEEGLLDRIVDLEYADKQIEGAMMVEALALCRSSEDAGVVMGVLRDVEVAGDVLWPCYKRVVVLGDGARM